MSTANPAIKTIQAFDNRDDKKEVSYLLQNIPPMLRVRWLKWCCDRCALPNTKKRPVVLRETTGENYLEIFYDFWNLVNFYRFDPLVGLAALVQVKRHWDKGHFTKGSPVRVHLPK